ncbi:MAG: hypothetical protein FJZ43_03080 [Candidatus Staskawiczbacteria bacterium]|nr:hypothetical protein [Candidatus Staskawiczbacteria bacterium]
MPFYFCDSKQYELDTGKGFGGGREIIEASSPEEARQKFVALRKEVKEERPGYRLLLGLYGFFGPFKRRKIARDIRHHHIRRYKRHSFMKPGPKEKDFVGDCAAMN